MTEKHTEFLIDQCEEAEVDFIQTVARLTEDGFDHLAIAMALAGTLRRVMTAAVPCPTLRQRFIAALPGMVTPVPDSGNN